jgi:hypothetical protein
MNEEPSPTHPEVAPVTNGRSVREIIDECKRRTRIEYRNQGGFFRPRLKGINHLEVGRSRIISNPITIVAEWFLYQWLRFRAWWTGFVAGLFPRRPAIWSDRNDSRLVGRIIYAGDRGNGPPIHHLHLEFWGRTRFFAWRKLSEGVTDANGEFALPFDLRQARRFWIRSLRFEVQKTTRVYFKENDPHFHYDLLLAVPVVKSDLIGMDYNLRTLRLDYWLYDEKAVAPRAKIGNVDTDAPESYSRGRIEALMNQIIPIELTKLKHLEQIALAPDTLTIPEIQADYPENLTTCIEKHLPGYTRGDDWFGERMMNGMNRAWFDPDPVVPGRWWVRYFGKCWYDCNDLYALPTVEIAFSLKEDGLPRPEEIRLTGRLSRRDHDDFEVNVYTPADEPQWTYAKRVARVSGSVGTEIEEHFAGTHLNTEQYAVAAFRNLRLNPVAALLLPHLKEVSLIDHSANDLLIRDYLPSATALTHEGILQRTRDILGLQDWKGWAPRPVLSEAHTSAKAEALFWDVLTRYVDEFFEKNAEGIRNYWLEIHRFSEDLVRHAVPVFLTDPRDSPPGDERMQALAAQRLAYYAGQYDFDPDLPRERIDGELKAVSPITHAPEWAEAAPEDWQNLKDACRYAIMMGTFMHTWINEHQYDDLGEILYNCGGLRFGDKPCGIMAPEDDYEIAQDLVRSTQMLWFTNLLSRTEYGFITKNEEGDVNPRFTHLLEEQRDAFLRLGVDIDGIESRTNI